MGGRVVLRKLLLVPQMLRQAFNKLLPTAVRQPVLEWWRRPRPVQWGRLRRLTPVSRVFGLDRGQPIDRYYIEAFLQRHADDIKGRVLEIGDSAYTRRFGGSRVAQADVLHAVPGNPQATQVGDLQTGQGIPGEAFDCFILTQTLQSTFEVQSAIRHAAAALKPGGVLLASLPGLQQISRYDADRWGDYWRFTAQSARRLFEAAFPQDAITVEACGNVLAVVAGLYGLAAGELTIAELAHRDPDYDLTITVRAVKPR